MQQVNHETTTEETPKDQEPPKEKEPEIKRVYTEEEAREVERDGEFMAFFDRTSRVMERFLSEPQSDYFADYTGESGDLYIKYSIKI